MTSTRTRRLLLLGLVVVIIAVAVIIFVTGGGSKKPPIWVSFPDATGVTLGYQVKVHGARVGTVGAVNVVDGHADLELNVDPSVYPLHQNATAWIRPLNLLGERYIELEPGSGPEMPQPYHIAADHTRTSVGLQDVLNTLNDPTSTALASTVTSLGEGVQNAGPQAADMIKALQPALTDTGRLAGILNQQNAILNRLVDRTSPVARAVGADGSKPLDHLLDTTNQTLATVNANRRAVDETVAQLPDTLASAKRTLDQLGGTAQAATPTLRAIRPVTDNLRDITGELNRLANAADPAVTSLRPVVQRADELLDQAAPAVAQLRPIGSDLHSAAANLQPFGVQLLQKNLSDLMDFVTYWALSTNGRDGVGHYFRGIIHVTPTTLGTILQDLPGSTLPVAAKTPGSLPVPAVPAGVPAAAQNADPGNATGLTAGQEQSMLGQMIGGR